MKWEEIRRHYPHQWLLVEAIKAHSASGKRIVEDMTIVNTYPDAREAMHGYTALHEQSPERELYVLHTDREILNITERRWLGVRGNV
ncbi:MAG: hypothetical protein KDJ52_22720 [Anaerolineae bacterium]|nr:hypothetical protein [Anaerolineae bacterium]